MKKKAIHVFYSSIKYITAVVCSVIIAVFIGILLYQSGAFLYGSDYYAQLFKINVIKNSINQGNFLPIYTKWWYNGYEIFRYTPPTSYLLITTISGLFGGNIQKGICAFYAIMTFLSQMGFFLFGVRHNKMIASCLTGLAFLFLPVTFYVAILEGCFDIVMAYALMPLLIFFLFDFIKEKRRMALFPFSILFLLLIFSNYIVAITFGIVIGLFLVVSMIAAKSWKFETAALGNMIFLYLVMGTFLYPAISGGLFSRKYILDDSHMMPVTVALLAIAILGIITTNKNRAAGFFMTILAVALSFPVMEPVMKLIPSKTLQKPYWYMLPIAVLLFATLLTWKRLRMLFLILMLGFLVGENIPTMMSLQESLAKENTMAKQEKQIADEYLFEEAVSCTNSRVALLDGSRLGAFPQWYFTSKDISVMSGWDFDNALTVRNQVSIEEAFADGFYDYVFDRLLLYGNDSVIVVKELLEEGAEHTLTAAANRIGYEVEAENEEAFVFHASNVPDTYGVISDYENLAIGDYGVYIAYIYPSFGLGRSNCLEDYPIEELEQYEKLYLSGFTYRDKEKAENMLKELSAKGVQIYIDMQHIPVNALTGKNEFMNVYAQFVQFTEDFPVLQNDNGNQFKLDFKAGGYEIWNTVYVSGCETVLKETQYDNKSHLVYLGQNSEPDITFMGFNLIYYYLTTHNQDLKRFLDEALDLSSATLSKPQIVPIKIENNLSEIIVTTKEDDVNCNIAALDSLQPNRIVSSQEKLYVVNQGETVFRIVSPKRDEGMFFSIIGIVLVGILWIMVYVLLENEIPSKKNKTGHNDKINII